MACANLGDYATDLSFLTSQLGTIAVAAQQAKARSDQADLDSLMRLYRQVATRTRNLRASLPSDAPSSFMVALDSFSDQAIGVGKSAFGIVEDFGQGAASITKAIPLVAIGLLVVLGIGLTKGTLSARWP